MKMLVFFLIIASLLAISIPATFAQTDALDPTAEEPSTAVQSDTQATNDIASKSQLSLDDLRTFTDVFNQIRLNYVEQVDDQTLLNSAIRGMLSDLDPHSAYMEADQYLRMEDDSMGRYSGIGVEVSTKNNRINVVLTMPGGAAENAGVVAGDIITSINRHTVTENNLKQSINALRGEPGTEVQVTVEHASGEVSDLTLKRDYIEVASVFSRPVDEDFGYFQITHFTRKTAEELQEQIEFMLANHNGPLKGAILDLRDNGGGVLQPAVTVADGFLDEGLIVYTEGRSPGQMRFSASPGQWLQDVPLVILVNESTASASEVLAGALQDQGRALIVGEQTFGKGSVQSVLNMRNGSGVRLTTSRYYTPSGRSIQATGIQPDIEIPDVQVSTGQNHSRREADLNHHLDAENNSETANIQSEVSAGDDFAMYQALILLKSAALLKAQY